MIASLNHDIKNPILSTITLIEYLKEGWVNNKFINIDHIELINYNMKLCLNLVEGFLDYT